MKQQEGVTIRDIAKHCHASIATVSRAINHRPGVSDALRTTILQYAQEQGYAPDKIAQSMRSGRLDRVYIVSQCDDNGDSLFHIAARGGSDPLSGIDIQYHTFPFRHDLITELQRLETAYRPRLFVIVGPCRLKAGARFNDVHTPLMFVLSDDAPTTYPCVLSDDLQGSEAVVDSLITAGHRRIAVVTDTSDEGLPSFPTRIEGYRASLERHGLTYDPSLVQALTINYDQYFSSAEEQIQRHVLPMFQDRISASAPTPTSIFVLSDFLALTLVRVLWNAGISVPHQLSIASFGGWTVTKYIPISLQTWVQPAEDIIAATTTAISYLLQGKPFPDDLPLPSRHPDGTQGMATAVTPIEYRIPGYLRVGQSVGAPDGR